MAAKIRNGEKGLRKAGGLIGKVVAGRYPAANYVGIRLRYEPRRVLVQSVRRLRDKPLERGTLKLDPYLRRFGVIVTGFDLDKRQERTFYLGAFRNWRVMKLDRRELVGDRHKMFIVERPADWRPTSPLDLPPEVEVHHEPTRRHAQLLAIGFNRAELRNPKGFWALA